MADIHVAPGEPALATPGFGTLLDSWRQIIATGNLPKGRAIDGLSRWLLITRACVFSMTLTSGLIGGLLAAATAAAPRWGYFELKHLGLGEPGVFVVWGPLMIGGTYYVTAGALPGWVWLASVPYALAVTTVLIGKHVDKYEQDEARGIHTLPVLLGREFSLRLNQAAMVAFYAIVLGLVVSGYLGVGVLIVAAALPRLRQVLKADSRPKPAAPPPGYRVWPLWYVSLAFYHNKLAGGLFLLGLALY